jgi:uncharacterized protein (TIGR02145 family)
MPNLVITSEVKMTLKINGANNGVVAAGADRTIDLPKGNYLVELRANPSVVSWRQTVAVDASSPTRVNAAVGKRATAEGIKTVQIGSLEWTAADWHKEELVSAPPAGHPEKDVRFYRYLEAALRAPAGWRLPTRDDFEALFSLYKDPFTALTSKNTSLFTCRLLGYWASVSHVRRGFEAMYWTSTPAGANKRVLARLANETVDFHWELEEQDYRRDKQWNYYSVRWVRELH